MQKLPVTLAVMRDVQLMLVEDEDAIVRPLTGALEREGFRVERFVTAESALEAMDRGRPALVLMDITLPGMSGLDACREIQERWGVPVMMLTARGEMEDRVLGLELGAADYVAKPFSSRELVARIRALLRRLRWGEHELGPIRIGGLTVDPGRRQVAVEGRSVHLKPREFDLLSYLAARSPAVVSRNTLMHELWDLHWEGSTQTLDVHVAELRRKIEPNRSRPRYLHTVRGVGYQVRDAVAEG
jgi:DNA-binding response OmpR family regulator